MLNVCKKNYCFNALKTQTEHQLALAFSKSLHSYSGTFDKVIILCVGTDRLTGDSLGPLTGYKLLPLLTKLKTPPVLFGTLEEPVHALNINNIVDKIYTQYSAPLVVAVDASLGLPQHIGRLSLKHGSLNPGSAVGKKLPAIGDITVTGVVNHYHFLDYAMLQNTRLNTVMKMAEVIAYGIFHGIQTDYTGIPSAL